jgi:CxxC motif-containing protein (DUF1111 family)
VCASPTLLGTKTLLEKTNSQEADWMRQKFIAVLVLLVAIVAVGLAGFDTPTLVQNPGSQSHSNGIAQPAGDTYDIETGDGIVQAGPQDTANKLRTAPLWGLGMRPRFIHDLRSFSLQNAIERHAGEAEHVRQRFQGLSPVEKQPLFSFLNSL